MRTLQESIIGKRGTPGIGNLPLIYDNIFIPGNVVTIEDSDENTIRDYIVISEDVCNFSFSTDFGNSKFILLRYTECNPSKYAYWTNIKQTIKASRFPVFLTYPENKIINIKGTIPESEIESIRTTNDLKSVFDKYGLRYAQH